MALSSGVRFSSFLRRKLAVVTAPTSTRLHSFSRSISDPRFYSIPPSHSDQPPRASSSGEHEEAERGDERLGETKVQVTDRNDDFGRIVPAELHSEATEAYMSYAMSVLLGRALPDVRDGLKPVHRRVLFAMHELGISSRKPFKKCARIVGEVLGKFHPHGDNAVYASLVRMAQDFSLRCPLIQGHGNFGSVDADPPAAMRYTECRLQALTEAMLLADIEQDTVDFVPNFDNSQKEPSLLPARLPTLLLNGSSGIAVGMATNIPPHNLGELVDVLCALIRNPEATLQELLEYMPGPDFPTGGLIMGNSGIIEAYQTGRGSIVVRGKTDVELLDSETKQTAIVIKEIPYQTNKSSLVEKIAELVEDKILEGINDIRDESDRTGMRIVIELKHGSDPSIVLYNLYRHTALQSSFSCNMVSIFNGQPKLMGLKEVLQAFLDFRCSVIERRASYKLSQARERRHIVEGILIGHDNLDGVIDVIRAASSQAMALASLRNEFHLSEKQADAILDLNLRRVNALESQKFVDECKSLTEQISKLEELLSCRENILQLIEEEAIELKNKFSTPRRSMLDVNDNGQLGEINAIPNKEILLAFGDKGYIKRMEPRSFNLLTRDTILCQAHDHILCFSDKGIVYSTRAYKIPECTGKAAGTPLVQILSLTNGERITSIVPISKFAEDQFLLMLTVNGYIKKVPLNVFSAIRSTGLIAIQLVPGDELKSVCCCSDDDLVALASQNGRVNLSSCENIRALGRATRGDLAMTLKGDDKIASIDVIPAAVRKHMEMVSESKPEADSGPWLLFVSQSGFGKRVPLNSLRSSPMNKAGVLGYKFSLEDPLAAVFVVGCSLAENGESDEQVVLVSHRGKENRVNVCDVPIQSRIDRGVKLIEKSGKIKSVRLAAGKESEQEEEGEVEGEALADC